MTSFGLKMLGIFTMLIDHIGFMFLDDYLELYTIFRIIGRLAFPIFAFQLAVGYSHSKNKEKHIGRMLIFALLSQIPFMMFIKLANPMADFVVMNGNRVMIKRKYFEQYIDQATAV